MANLTNVVTFDRDARTMLGQVHFSAYVKDDGSTGLAEWTVTSVSYDAARTQTTLTFTGRDVPATEMVRGPSVGMM